MVGGTAGRAEPGLPSVGVTDWPYADAVARTAAPAIKASVVFRISCFSVSVQINAVLLGRLPAMSRMISDEPTRSDFGALVHSRSVRRPYMRRLAQATAEDSLETAIDDRIPNVAMERAVAPVTSPTSAGARIGLLFEKARKMCGVSRKRLGRFLRLFVWLP